MEVKDRGHSMNEPNKYNRVNVLKRKLREKSLALLKQGIECIVLVLAVVDVRMWRLAGKAHPHTFPRYVGGRQTPDNGERDSL